MSFNIFLYKLFHYYCRFKVRFELQVHMKSSAHVKTCTALGVHPVPDKIQPSQVDKEAEKLQVSIFNTPDFNFSIAHFNSL